jgi:hypothetical protein
LRQNVLGLVAIFLALNAGAYAITSAQSKQVFNQDLGNGSVTSATIADGGVEGIDIHSAAVGPKKIKLDKLVKYLQTRVNAQCDPGQTMQGILADGSVICAKDQIGTGTITGITTSGGLTGGGSSGDVALGIDPSVVQSRISGACTGNTAVRSVSATGAVACQPTGTGTVNSVGSGFGLTGGPITDSGTLAADPTVLQRRVSGTCATNNAIQTIAQDGTVGCRSVVTGITAGTGLSTAGGTITSSGTLAVDPTAVQTRLQNGCTGTETVQSVSQTGVVSCSDPLAPRASVLTPDLSQIDAGDSQTVVSVDGVSFVNNCGNPPDASLVVVANPGTAADVAADSHSLGFVTTPTLDGNNANNFVVVATSPGVDRGEVNVHVTTGPFADKTIAVSFYLANPGTDCQIAIDGVAG